MLSSILSKIVPKDKLWITDPGLGNMDPNYNGVPIPILWGEKSAITPICIDAATGLYLFAGHELISISNVRTAELALVAGIDYTLDLANGRITLQTCPRLTPGVQYYFSLEADNTCPSADYLLNAIIPAGGYPDGVNYEINGAAVWTPGTGALCFNMWGRENMTDEDFGLINYPAKWPGSGWSYNAPLRDIAARTRIGQGFKLPAWAANPIYLTKIQVFPLAVGAPTGELFFKIFSDIAPAEVQVGSRSFIFNSKQMEDWVTTDYIDPYHSIFPLREAGVLQLTGDAIGKPVYGSSIPMTNIAPILEDLLLNEAEVDPAKLNGPSFAALEAEKTQELTLYLKEETELRELLERFEAGQMVKIIQNLDGEINPIFFEVGAPSGTPHYFDEDFINFRMSRDYTSICGTIKILYDEEPAGLPVHSVEVVSDVARFVYGKNDTKQVETFLKDEADAIILGTTLSGIFESPLITAEFELGGGAGFDLQPGD